MRGFRLVLAVFLVAAVCLVAPPDNPVGARQDLSLGCNRLNGPAFDNVIYTGYTLNGYSFTAGEIVTVIAKTPDTNAAGATVTLSVGGSQVGSAPYSPPTSLSHTIAADGVVSVGWAVSAGGVTWDISCAAGGDGGGGDGGGGDGGGGDDVIIIDPPPQSASCSQLNGPAWDYRYDAWSGSGQFNIGETITLTTSNPDAGVTQTEFLRGGVAKRTGAPTGTITYTFQETTDVISFGWRAVTGNVDWQVSCAAATAPIMIHVGHAASDTMVPGCCVCVDTAVVGSFVMDATVYWGPGLDKLVSPLIVIPAGQTAWVLGKDVTGQFYKIIWSCQYLWVPVETMGPNYDDLWQGTPLPELLVT